jgi:hypothetical protein
MAFQILVTSEPDITRSSLKLHSVLLITKLHKSREEKVSSKLLIRKLCIFFLSNVHTFDFDYKK